MPQYESPLGNKKFAGSQLKEFDVPDESGIPPEQIVNPVARRKAGLPALNIPEIQRFAEQMQELEEDPAVIEREIKEARKAKFSGKERLSEGAKRRIDMLLGMTKTTHEVDINGNEYVFQVLSSKSFREAIVMAAEFDGTVLSPFEVRRQFLVRSITHIAGVEFNQFVGSNNLEDKLVFIDELDEALLNRLYAEYLKMNEIAKEKYSIKNEVEAKEIIEDLKK